MIRYNGIETWPIEAVKLLRTHSAELVQYAQRDDELALMSSTKRWGQTNSFAHVWKDACAQLAAIFAGQRIAAVHYTRLAPDEIESMRNDGIRISCVDYARERIRRRVEARDLTPEQGHQLVEAQVYDKAGNGERQGMFWICVGGGPPDEGGIYRFLQYWGGEAIYARHDERPMGHVLRGIGQPCVVEIAVSPEDLHQYAGVGERFVTAWIKRERREEDRGFEGYLTRNVNASQVLRVITRHDEDFDSLTGVSTWQEPPW